MPITFISKFPKVIVDTARYGPVVCDVECIDSQEHDDYKAGRAAVGALKFTGKGGKVPIIIYSDSFYGFTDEQGVPLNPDGSRNEFLANELGIEIPKSTPKAKAPAKKKAPPPPKKKA